MKYNANNIRRYTTKYEQRVRKVVIYGFEWRTKAHFDWFVPYFADYRVMGWCQLLSMGSHSKIYLKVTCFRIRTHGHVSKSFFFSNCIMKYIKNYESELTWSFPFLFFQAIHKIKTSKNNGILKKKVFLLAAAYGLIWKIQKFLLLQTHKYEKYHTKTKKQNKRLYF